MCDVLLLDDDALVLMTLAESLRDAGFVVGQARNAEDVTDWFAHELPPLLLVADLDLGTSSSGEEVARLTRDRHPGLPIIFISGLPASHRSIEPDETVFAKPFMPAALVAAIRSRMTPRAL